MEQNLNLEQLSRDELLSYCTDLRLPVSRYDKKEVLLNYIKAAYDEVETSTQEDILSDEFDLENNPVFIGKSDFTLTGILGKILTFF